LILNDRKHCFGEVEPRQCPEADVAGREPGVDLDGPVAAVFAKDDVHADVANEARHAPDGFDGDTESPGGEVRGDGQPAAEVGEAAIFGEQLLAGDEWDRLRWADQEGDAGGDAGDELLGD
jgi:hypothetical protein